MSTILQLQRRATCERYDPDAYLLLCQALVNAGKLDYAADTFDRWQQVDPGNPTIAYHRSILLQAQAPNRAPTDYLVHEFDEFADSFDMVLTRLGYSVPHRFEAMLSRYLDRGPTARTVDLGCGTGLCGIIARPYSSHLCGVDLSPRMLERAHWRGIYDQLVESEICSYLERCDEPLDLVIAGDSLIYFGDLEPVIEHVAAAMRADGLLMLSLELASEGDGYRLSTSGRYQHSRSYLEAVLLCCGYEPVAVETGVLRDEAGYPVEGMIAVARLRG